MLFNSLGFLLFLPVVVSVYYFIPSKVKQIWLLIASYFFYMCWNVKYALLLLASTSVTYISAIMMGSVRGNKTLSIQKKMIIKRFITGIGIIINLMILIFFKYANFIIDSLNTILNHINIKIITTRVDVLLPVGISFYTFQALGYLIDVYREEILEEKNFINFALFVSFFPQLVAGPIERSKNLLSQLSVHHSFDFKFRDGLLLMIWGFFLKLVLADRIALFVDTVYGDIETYPGWYLIIATVLFAVQIYCDFSGYSVIAMGTAEMLGIKLMDNFNSPYLSLSVSEFWSRWHISLSSWFRDYLYIPLGGNRKGKFRKHLNRFIVFLVSGLWHGANYTFIIWGGLNGLYQSIGEGLQPIRDWFVGKLQINRNTFGHKMLCAISTFFLICISWVFFRSNSIKEAIEILHSMISVHNPWILINGGLLRCGLDYNQFVVLIIGIQILIFADIVKHRGYKIRKWIVEQNYWFRCILIAVSIVLILTFGMYGADYDAAGFIYFQF